MMEHSGSSGAKDCFATRSGLVVDRTNPQASDHCIEDLAHSLSRICRFGGAVASFYSVGEHSLHVSEQLEARYPEAHPRLYLAGLVHDGSELSSLSQCVLTAPLRGCVAAFPEIALSDLLKPIKSQLPDYQALEERYEATIAEAFGLTAQQQPQAAVLAQSRCALSWPWPAEVMSMDTQMLVTEALQLMPWTVSSHWLAKGQPLKITIPDRRFVVTVVLADGRVEDFSSYPGLVEAVFLRRFYDLQARIAEWDAR